MAVGKAGGWPLTVGSRSGHVAVVPWSGLTPGVPIHRFMLGASIGAALVTLGCGASEPPTEPTPPPPPPRPRVWAVGGNDQTGSITTTLPLPLRVVVDSAGTKLAGVTVVWHAAYGSIEPHSDATNAAGIATATWTFDTVAGDLTATAAVADLRDSVTFSARAVGGPAVSLRKIGEDSQTLGVNADFSRAIAVRTTDRYGNSAPGQVRWTVEHGPLTLIEGPFAAFDGGDGYSEAYVRPTGTEGDALARASLVGTAAAVDFSFTVKPPQYVVVLHLGSFVSVQNRSTNPAVDTIPVGQTVVWRIDFDWDPHHVVSVGTPSFLPVRDGGGILVRQFHATFTAPGTYHYTDLDDPNLEGIIVVQ